MDDGQIAAIKAYRKNTGRLFLPGDVVRMPLDALAFSKHQTPYLTLDEFKLKRCVYDEETNDWLVRYVTLELRQPDIPEIYIDILEDGLALVDGVHRTTGAFLSGDSWISARVNAL